MGIAKVILDSILGLGRFSWSGLKATSYISYSLTKNTLRRTTNFTKNNIKKYATKASNKIPFGEKLYKVGKIGTKIAIPVTGVGLLSYFITKPIKDYVEHQNEKVQKFKEKSNRLEFNDYLGNGYFSFKASTERQRAQNLLDQSNFSGRELLGTEAEHYA
ncbi:MAG: hypothetical protein IJ880_00185 [Bacilli bacterium]|nr:hypothetical protein [Bacilli bacterium]